MPNRNNHLLAALSREVVPRHGLLTRSQMERAGASRQHIDRWCDAGLLQRMVPEVFLLAGHPQTWRCSLLANCLVTGGLASHRAAAALHGLDGCRPGKLEIVVPRLQTVRHPGVHQHESTDLHLTTPTTVDGIPVTPVARTLLDLGAVSKYRVHDAVLDAVSRGLTTWPELYATLQSHSARGRRGCGPLRAVLDVHFGDASESQIERLFLRIVRKAGLPAPTAQQEVFDALGFIMRLDFAWVPLKVAVEIDSLKHHATSEAFEEDRRKRNRLRLAGWLLLEFTAKRMRQSPTRVCAEVAEALAARAVAADS